MVKAWDFEARKKLKTQKPNNQLYFIPCVKDIITLLSNTGAALGSSPGSFGISYTLSSVHSFLDDREKEKQACKNM